MSVAIRSKAQRCPSCGTKNPPDLERCRVCTRTLPHEGYGMQAEFEDALYSQPVRGAAGPTRRRSMLPLAVIVVAGLAAWNYFSLGYGPSWAHQAVTHRPGGNWHTVTDVPGMRVELPGAPIVDGADTEAGFLRRARVGVDAHWDAVLDRTVKAPADQRAAIDHLYATLVAASSDPITDAGTALPQLIGGLVPDITLSDVSIVESGGDASGTSYDVVAGYRGFPDSSDRGTVRARVEVSSTRTAIVASLSDQADSASLYDRLVAGFSPGDER